MISRQEIKTNARKALKKHYWMIVGICLISAFIGLEFTSSMDFMDLMALTVRIRRKGVWTGA